MIKNRLRIFGFKMVIKFVDDGDDVVDKYKMKKDYRLS